MRSIFAWTALGLSCLTGVIPSPALRADTASEEAKYYEISSLPIPEGIVLEAGAQQLMPDGRLAISTRLGKIYMVENPQSRDLSKVKFVEFASGLHEVLGLAYRDGWLYCNGVVR